MSQVTKSITGSCHCKAITYTVDLPVAVLSAKSAGRCNCTWCQKPGFTLLRLDDPAAFHLLTPASTSDLADYHSAKNDGDGNKAVDVHRYFCATCGTHVLRRGMYTFNGQVTNFATVNLATVDQPQDGIELSEWKMAYVDGFGERWMDGQKDGPCAHGLV